MADFDFEPGGPVTRTVTLSACRFSAAFADFESFSVRLTSPADFTLFEALAIVLDFLWPGSLAVAFAPTLPARPITTPSFSVPVFAHFFASLLLIDATPSTVPPAASVVSSTLPAPLNTALPTDGEPGGAPGAGWQSSPEQRTGGVGAAGNPPPIRAS